MPLKDPEVKYASRRQRPYKLSDGGGLNVLVQPKGSKLWWLKYRFGSKEKLLSFGKYPEVTLAIARAKHEEAKALLAAGKDPANEPARNNKPPPPKTLKPVARVWHANSVDGLDPAQAARIISRMERDVFQSSGTDRSARSPHPRFWP